MFLLVQAFRALITPCSLEETESREEFNAAHGEYLPMDVCLSMTNLPVQWQIMGEGSENLPEVDPDTLAEVRTAFVPIRTECLSLITIIRH